VRADSSVFLRSSRGPRGAPRRGWYGKFAGILQVKIRQRVSGVRMLIPIYSTESKWSCLSRDTRHNRLAKKHRRLSLAHHRA
jgi:hypothetical protein